MKEIDYVSLSIGIELNKLCKAFSFLLFKVGDMSRKIVSLLRMIH